MTEVSQRNPPKIGVNTPVREKQSRNGRNPIIRAVQQKMAANPEAAGSAGLAAAAAGDGAGGTLDPLDDVRAIFTTLGMTITHRDSMINAYNLTGMEDFDYIKVDDAR